MIDDSQSIQIEETDAPLDDVLAVVEYLTKAGWRIKKSTAYNHRDKGWLRPGADGKYTRAAVDKYANQKLKRLDGKQKDRIERINANRQEAETRKIIAQAQREELKLKIAEGQYVPRETLGRELSYRIMVFKVDGETFCRSQAGSIIELFLDGLEAKLISWGKEKHPDKMELITEIVKEVFAFLKDKTPDLMEFLLGEFHKWLSRYAEEREFEVPQPAAAEILQEPEDDTNDEETDGGIS